MPRSTEHPVARPRGRNDLSLTWAWKLIQSGCIESSRILQRLRACTLNGRASRGSETIREFDRRDTETCVPSPLQQQGSIFFDPNDRRRRELAQSDASRPGASRRDDAMDRNYNRAHAFAPRVGSLFLDRHKGNPIVDRERRVSDPSKQVDLTLAWRSSSLRIHVKPRVARSDAVLNTAAAGHPGSPRTANASSTGGRTSVSVPPRRVHLWRRRRLRDDELGCQVPAGERGRGHFSGGVRVVRPRTAERGPVGLPAEVRGRFVGTYVVAETEIECECELEGG